MAYEVGYDNNSRVDQIIALKNGPIIFSILKNAHSCIPRHSHRHF
ncbi:hypothetical protein SAMN05216308_107128 [Nitrosospira sp. Nsp13]|nr:hypothetical protein SAMN05216308_107128 [Nitrosospira sp. Nsp13]